MYYVILFAMVAAFLALRLYSVLGKRTGHEQPLPKPAEERVGTCDVHVRPRHQRRRHIGGVEQLVPHASCRREETHEVRDQRVSDA